MPPPKPPTPVKIVPGARANRAGGSTKGSRAKQLSDHKTRIAMAYRLRVLEGKTFPEVGRIMGCTPERARQFAKDGAKECLSEEVRDEARNTTLVELDALRAKAYEYLHGDYVMVQFGKVATLPVVDPGTGQVTEKPIKDVGPNLAALDRILKLEKRRAEIFGYDAPRRSSVQVVTEDPIMAEINRLREEMEMAEAEIAREAAAREAAAKGEGQPTN
jgi:hypothetical protein